MRMVEHPHCLATPVILVLLELAFAPTNYFCILWTGRPFGKMSTRNNRYEEDYVVDENTVRRRNNRRWSRTTNRGACRRCRDWVAKVEAKVVRSMARIRAVVASKRRNRNRRNVPTDDLGRFDHYIRVGLPSQFFYHYNRLLRYELDLIKRFINYTATWSRTEYCMSCCNSKNMFMDISIFVIFIGPVSSYFYGLPAVLAFLRPDDIGVHPGKIVRQKGKAPLRFRQAFGGWLRHLWARVSAV